MGEYWDAFPPGPSPQLWWSWGSGWDAIMRGWHAMRSAYVVFDVLRAKPSERAPNTIRLTLKIRPVQQRLSQTDIVLILSHF